VRTWDKWLELSGVFIRQVCCKAIYEIEVACHDNTEVRTHVAFHWQMRPPLLERLMLIVRDPSFPPFRYITVLHHVTVSDLLQSPHKVLRKTKTSCHEFILCVVHETAGGREELNLPVDRSEVVWGRAWTFHPEGSEFDPCSELCQHFSADNLRFLEHEEYQPPLPYRVIIMHIHL
jgi:hypothetical protein